jgi:hypothetical protein
MTHSSLTVEQSASARKANVPHSETASGVFIPLKGNRRRAVRLPLNIVAEDSHMMLVQTATAAEPEKRRFVTGDGMESTVIPYFGLFVPPENKPVVGTLFPVAFRVEQDPHSVAEPHFHQANQFQVFVAGDGSLGKRDVRPIAVQYADAYTPYGPIVAGDAGISYMTLRNGYDPGAYYMPGARDTLKSFARKPRALYAEPVEPRPALHAGAAPELEPIIPAEESGLAAWRLRLAPGATSTGPDPAQSGGQYWLVVAGSDAGGLEARSCRFLSADEAAHVATAGPDGLDALILQFPRFAAAGR